MQEQISEIPAQPVVPSSPSIKLWSPGFIAAVTFFLGFPAGIALACINWMRMNLNNKALVHLVAGFVGILVFIVAIVLIPESGISLFTLALNLGALLYLRQAMRTDQENFKAANNRVENANGLGGCLIGLGVLVLFMISMFVVGMVLAILGIPIVE